MERKNPNQIIMGEIKYNHEHISFEYMKAHGQKFKTPFETGERSRVRSLLAKAFGSDWGNI